MREKLLIERGHFLPLVCGLLACVLQLVTREAHAQGNVVITGVVVSQSAQPVAAAVVRVTQEGGRATAADTTDSNGRYTLTLQSAAARYLFVVTAEGLQTLRQSVSHDSAAFLRFVLMPSPVLDTVRVAQNRRRRASREEQSDLRANDQNTGIVTPTTGLGAVGPSDPLSLLAQTPGFQRMASPDGSGYQLVLLGDMQGQHTLQLNGVGNAAGMIPRSAFVNMSASPLTADVTRGGYSGALVDLVLNASQRWGGSIGMLLDDPALQPRPASREPVNQGRRLQQVFGNLSMPLRRGGLRGGFDVAAQVDHELRSLPSLINARDVQLEPFGLNRAQVDDALRTAADVGLPVGSASRDGPQRVLLGGSSSMRLNLSGARNSFSASLLAGSRRRDGLGAALLTAPSAMRGSVMSSVSGSTTWSRYWRNTIHRSTSVNSTWLSDQDRRSDPLPSAWVRFGGSDDGGLVQTTLGSAYRDATNRGTHTVDLLDQTTWFSLDGRHLLSMAVGGRRASLRVDPSNRGRALFEFASLDALRAGAPQRYTRTFAESGRRSMVEAASLAIMDAWRISPRTLITVGARIDADRLRYAGPLDTTALRIAGESGTPPRSWFVSPSLSVSHSYGRTPVPQSSGPAGRVSGTLRLVRGTFDLSQAYGVSASSGVRMARELQCAGNEVPVPDWHRFQQDPDSWPDNCRGTVGVQPASQQRSVTLLGDGVAPPMRAAWSVSWMRYATARARVTVGSLGSVEWQRPETRDRNLRDLAQFALSEEAQRPVFAPSNAITTGGGISTRDVTRRDLSRDQVWVTRSTLRAQAAQWYLRLAAPGNLFPTWSLDYSWLTRREQVSGWTDGLVAAHPDQRNWQRAAFDGQHVLAARFHRLFFGNTYIEVDARAESGLRYTPRIFGDVNGDGLTNDRAFIPEASTALGAAVRAWSEQAPERLRRCALPGTSGYVPLQRCRAPGLVTANVAVTLTPPRTSPIQRGELTLRVTNVLAGLDQLLHGGTRGWGQPAIVDRHLLVVDGFDPVARRYLYTVNSAFGRARRDLAFPVNPLALVVEARFDLGPDRRRQFIERIRSADAGRAGEALPLLRIVQSLQSNFPDPASSLVSGRRSIPDFSAAQDSALRELARSYEIESERILMPLAQRILNLPARYNPAEVMRRFEEPAAALSVLIDAQQTSIRQILRPEQLRRLPPSLARWMQPNPSRFTPY